MSLALNSLPMNVLEQVELRLLISKREGKLDAALQTFLVPLIQKLESATPEVVAKVNDILSFVATTVRDGGAVLPRQKLVQVNRDYIGRDAAVRHAAIWFMSLADCTPSELLYGLFTDSDQTDLFFLSLVYSEDDELKLESQDENGQLLDVNTDVQKLQSLCPQMFLYNYNMLSPEVPARPPLDVRQALLRFARKFRSVFFSTILAALADDVVSIRDAAKTELKAIREDVKDGKLNLNICGHTLFRFMECASPEVREASLQWCLETNISVPLENIKSCLAAGFYYPSLALISLNALIVEFNHGKMSEQEKVVFGSMLMDFLQNAEKNNVPVPVRSKAFETLALLQPTRSTLLFLLSSEDKDVYSTIQQSLSTMQVSLDKEDLLQRMREARTSRSRMSLITLAGAHAPFMVDDSAQKVGDAYTAMLALYALQDDIAAHTAYKLLAHLPEFNEFFLLLQSESTYFTKKTSPRLIESCVLYLWCCYSNTPTTFYANDWKSKVKTQLEHSCDFDSTIFVTNKIEFTKYLLSLVPFGIKLETLQLVLRVFLSRLDKQELDTFRYNIYSYLDTAPKQPDDPRSFTNFAAEYGSLLSNDEIIGSSVYHTRARAFKYALDCKYPTDVSLFLKDKVSLQVLALCGRIEQKKLSEITLAGNDLAFNACITLGDPDKRKEMLEKLLKDDSLKSLISTAESISISCCGWKSPVLLNRYPQLRRNVSNHAFPDFVDLELEQYCLTQIIENLNSKHDEYLAAVRLDYLVSCLDPRFSSQLQLCLINLFSRGSDVVQDITEKSMSKLFFRSDKKHQVILLTQLLENKAAKYQTLVAIARNSGSPALVYRFFDPKTGKIPIKCVPFLYRRLFDSNKRLKSKAQAIFDCLPSGCVKENIKEIQKELEKSIVSQDVYTRDSAALAYASLISRNLLGVSCDLWRLAFRINETNKDTSLELGKALAKAPVQSDESIEFLFSIMDIYNPAVHALLVLGSKPGKYRDKYASKLLEAFILYLSDYEHPMINYMSLTSQDDNTDKNVDQMRFEMLSQSIVYTNCEKLIESPDNIPHIWSTFASAIQRSVGIPSKLAAAQLICLTASTQSTEERFPKGVLNVMLNELFSSNRIVSHSYAVALGAASNYMPEAVLVDYANVLRAKFIDYEKFEVIEDAIRQLHPNSYDAVRNLLLPVIALGYQADQKVFGNMHDGLHGNKLEILEYSQFILAESNSAKLRKAAKEVTVVYNK